jgi:hypothetical protein
MSDSFGLGPGPMSRPDPAEPPRRSSAGRVLLWVLVILVIVGVALTGGAYAAGMIGDDNDSAAAPATGAPAPASTAPTGSGGTAASNPGPGSAGTSMKVALPATLGGVEKLKTTGKNKPTPDLFPATARAEGLFGLDDRNIMYVWALSGASVAQEERAALFGTEVGNRFDTGTLIAVEPGPIGGAAQCGNGKWEGRPAAVCVWSDGDSDGVVVDSPGNPEALAGKLPALRAEVERPA